VLFVRRVNRAELFRTRKQHYYESVIAFTRQYAEEKRQLDSVYSNIDDLDRFVKDRFAVEHKQFKGGLWLFLSFITLGVFFYIAIARLMRFWWEIQITEQDFDEKLTPIWTKLGVTKYPVTFQPMQELRRSFWPHFLLTIVTIGIYGIVWDYQIHNDPDKVYPEFHAVEDTVLNAVRTAA